MGTMRQILVRLCDKLELSMYWIAFQNLETPPFLVSGSLRPFGLVILLVRV
jgi:hypothetical protein